MAKAKRVKEFSEKLSFTIMDIDKENNTFVYIDEYGEEKEGLLANIFNDIKLPFDITLKSSDKEELDIKFETDCDDEE